MGFFIFFLGRADCTFQIPNYLESLKLMNLADYAWALEPMFRTMNRTMNRGWPNSWPMIKEM